MREYCNNLDAPSASHGYHCKISLRSSPLNISRDPSTEIRDLAVEHGQGGWKARVRVLNMPQSLLLLEIDDHLRHASG
jgi:hypothetical protein